MNPDDFLRALAQDSIAAGLLVLLVLSAQRLFRRQLAPGWRCALWLLVVVRLLPFSFTSELSLLNMLPAWPGESLSSGPSQQNTTPLVQAPDARTSDIPSVLPPDDTSDSTATEPGDNTGFDDANLLVSFISALIASPAASLLYLWLGGVLVLGGYVGSLTFALSRRTARLVQVSNPEVTNVLRDCCLRMGIRRAPILVEDNAVQTPALHGLFRPRLLLPRGFAKRFSREEIAYVFLHELAHVRRHDIALNWLITVLQVVHWFNPLLWFGFGRWRADREIACDAAALTAIGANHRHAYGHTVLRLLENFSRRRRQPGLIGILESHGQLVRRIEMIKRFSPPQRPFLAVALLSILGVVGLTDAQVPAPFPPGTSVTGEPTTSSDRRMTIPSSDVRYVLFLVNASGTMGGKYDPAPQQGEMPAIDNSERGRVFIPRPVEISDEEKRAAPRWKLAAQTLEEMLHGLPTDSNFHVAVFFDEQVESIGGRVDPDDRMAIPATMARLRSKVPIGEANLEAAFAFVATTLHARLPERIVLITDGLPTTSWSAPSQGAVPESARVRCFEFATKRLVPNLPIHTVLLPAPPGEPAAPGLYWELANVTRGGLRTPAKPSTEPSSHVAFVIDTSGSMRDPAQGTLWPIVIDTVEAALDAHPQLAGVQVLDGDGRFILDRTAAGTAGWHANTPEMRERIRRALASYRNDSISNPVPGISRAIQLLYDRNAPDMRMAVYILGDEFIGKASETLGRVETLNPRDPSGRRPVVINAFGFPTTIRSRFSMGNTGLKFANLMRLLTEEHGGAFIALPAL